MNHITGKQLLQMIDGTLPESKKEEYIAHLRSCYACRKNFASIIQFEKQMSIFFKLKREKCPDPMELWELDQGLLEAERVEEIKQHLSYCSICELEQRLAAEMTGIFEKLEKQELQREMKSISDNKGPTLTKQEIAGIFYSALMVTYIISRPFVRRGAGAAPSKNRLDHEDEHFRWEIYQEGNSLIFSLEAKSKDYVGKYVTISVISAVKVDYRRSIIQWKQEGPENIGSDNPINHRGWIEFVIAETILDMDIEDDFNLLQQIFQDIELRIFAEKGEGNIL